MTQDDNDERRALTSLFVVMDDNIRDELTFFSFASC